MINFREFSHKIHSYYKIVIRLVGSTVKRRRKQQQTYLGTKSVVNVFSSYTTDNPKQKIRIVPFYFLWPNNFIMMPMILGRYSGDECARISHPGIRVLVSSPENVRLNKFRFNNSPLIWWPHSYQGLRTGFPVLNARPITTIRVRLIALIFNNPEHDTTIIAFERRKIRCTFLPNSTRHFIARKKSFPFLCCQYPRNVFNRDK